MSLKNEESSDLEGVITSILFILVGIKLDIGLFLI